MSEQHDPRTCTYALCDRCWESAYEEDAALYETARQRMEKPLISDDRVVLAVLVLANIALWGGLLG